MHSYVEDETPTSVTAMLRQDFFELAKRVAKYLTLACLLYGLALFLMYQFFGSLTVYRPAAILQLVWFVAWATYASYRKDPPDLTQMNLSRP